MKTLPLILLLITALKGNANNYYLFTDTKESTGKLPVKDEVTWIINDKTISLITETQDVVYSYHRSETIQGLLTDYDKYYLENGNCIYIDRQTMNVIFCTETEQYLFRIN